MVDPKDRSNALRRATLMFFALVLLSACGGSPRTGPETRDARIILGHLRFTPDALTVKAGTTVRFVLVNSEAIEHEFVLGSSEVQDEHERTMSGGHMTHNPDVASVPANKTVELIHTFEKPGVIPYGCHVDDHYAQGMKGAVTVT